MKYIYIIAFSASILFVKAQGNLAVHVSAEETIVFGDSRSSFNFANLQNLSSNSGMRGGLHYTFNDQFSAEATLGVTGSSRPNTWYTKIVPVEIIGHYNVLTLLNDDSPYKFNADFGVGSALVSARSNNFSTAGAAGNFAFTENANLGASLDIPFKNLGLLTFGYRHTFFINDYVDATIIEGSRNDQMARFFTAIRVNLGQSAKTKTLLAEAEEKAVARFNLIAAELKDAQAKVKTMEKANARMKSLELQLQEAEPTLADSLSSIQDRKLSQVVDVETDVKEIQGYAVIVASFKNKEVALNMALELGGATTVIDVPEIGQFRVAHETFTSYTKAKEARKNIAIDFENCWIVEF